MFSAAKLERKLVFPTDPFSFFVGGEGGLKPCDCHC